MKVLGYLVVPEKGEPALFLSKSRAEDFAVRHHGVITPLVSLEDVLLNREDKSLD